MQNGPQTPRTYAPTNNAGKSQSNAAPSTPNQRGFAVELESNETRGMSRVPRVVNVR